MSTKADVTARILDSLQLVIASSVMTNERIARSMGLNVVDLQALGFIARNGAPMSTGEISRQTELPTSTTTRVLDRLEQRGLIERAADPSDRRRVVVQLRPDALPGAGRGGGDDPYAGIVAGMERVHEGFTVAELEVVARYLDAVKDVR
ncbi:DNA-binding MarR family transcriptional regulator [Agromyces flavus]|uniref:DNA-binding MarR family transcriptional regulator n=1 Tax=Agromyces flavus TaxID=589382 RepID=A0A1H1XV28_9MICO|nr:MarR family transcriptional regulator [Agromyces flavus]MCP2366512.1 DNA-binding MarR family transcriptional regulator [Agromyces flavus]GGI44824.1 MarR family transcriptional regulator [Agromyces flavus]SDT12871.1 MarR family protein [Agromyces flavus]